MTLPSDDPERGRTGVAPGVPGRSAILTVVLGYAAFASLWILLSDKAVALLVADPATLTLVSTFKGWFFVAVTSVLLLGLMQRTIGQVPSPPPPAPASGWRSLILPAALVSVAILVLTGIGVATTFSHQKAREAVRLQAIAELKARQVGDWLAERRANALFIANNGTLTSDFQRWRSSGDAASRDRLREHLAEYGRNNGFHGVRIVSDRGVILWDSEGTDGETDPVLRPLLLAPGVRQGVQVVGPYRDRRGRLHLDFLVSLPAVDGHLPPFVVLHIDPAESLYAPLGIWPGPSHSGEMVLFRRDGDAVLFLSDLRHYPDAAASLRLPLGTPQLLSARVLRGEIQAGTLAEGLDYRDAAVVGVVYPIRGSDWFLAAKVDQLEAYGEATRDATWIALAGILSLLITIAGAFLLRQRQQLELAQQESALRGERLRSLQLLDAIAEASDAAIYAKDLEGRYLFFNRAAGMFTGKDPKAVLGNDDRALFPEDEAEALLAVGREVLSTGRVLTREEALTTAIGHRIFLSTRGPLYDRDGRIIGHYGLSRDITERETAAAALREKDDLLREMSAIAHIGAWAFDPRTGQGTWTEEAALIYGVDPTQAVTPDMGLTFYHGPSRELVAEAMREAVDRAQPYDLELELVTADGRHKWVRTIGQPVVDGGPVVQVRGSIQDITQRKQAEVDLHASEERFHGLFENMQEGFFLGELLLDKGGEPVDWRLLDVNPAFSRILGLPREKAVGATVRELLPDLDEPWFASHCRVALGGGTENMEVRLAANGRLYETFLYAPRQGQFACVFADITERRLSDERLRASEARFRQLFDLAPMPLSFVREDGTITEFNARFEQTFGYSHAEIPTLDQWWQLAYPDATYRRWVMEVWEAAVQRALVAGTDIPPAEYRVTCRDGQVRTMLISGVCIGSHILATFFDVSERKAAEEQLRKLSLAVEQSPESVVIINLGGAIEYVNETFVLVTGYARDEALGRDLRVLLAEGPEDDARLLLWQTLGQGQTWRGEFHNRRKDGSSYVEYSIVTPIRQPDGRITHYVAINEDVSEKRRVAAELAQYRHHLEELVERRTMELEEAKTAAETANQAKSAFLANMSHEIRTPMNAILGLTHLLGRSLTDPLQRERLTRIDGAANHLLAVINDILDLSKIEAGKLVLEPVDFSPKALFDQLHSLIREGLASKGLAFVSDTDALPSLLRGDVTRLRQGLLNYLGNAVKFTQVGSVTLRARIVEEDAGTLLVRFEVADTGVGIPATKVARLFSAFEQADNSTTRKYGGTGLGLAITRRLAGLMGGAVGVDSPPTGGSVFWFTARLGRSDRRPAPRPDVSADRDAESVLGRDFRHCRVLLVEDNVVNQEVALDLLRATGLQVDLAENGQVALDLVAANDFDVILMDMQMPVMDGLEATRQLRASPRWGQRPIIALTANAFGEDRQRCLDAGMDDFIAKPVEPEMLYRVLLRWLSAPGEAAIAAAAATDRDTQERQLRALGGFDLQRGLVCVRGKVAKLVHLLHMFADGQSEAAVRIEAALARGERDEALHLAHSVKGAAGTLGAVAVQECAAALEKALRDGTDRARLEPLQAALAAALDALILGINGIENVEAVAKPVVDERRLAAVLNQLDYLLREGDMGVNDLARGEGDLIRAALAGQGEELLASIAAFDYDTALAILRAHQGRSPA